MKTIVNTDIINKLEFKLSQDEANIEFIIKNIDDIESSILIGIDDIKITNSGDISIHYNGKYTITLESSVLIISIQLGLNSIPLYYSKFDEKDNEEIHKMATTIMNQNKKIL